VAEKKKEEQGAAGGLSLLTERAGNTPSTIYADMVKHHSLATSLRTTIQTGIVSSVECRRWRQKGIPVTDYPSGVTSKTRQ